MIDNFIKQFQVLEGILSKEKGNFELFALFLREDSLDKWDLLISATWIKKDGTADLRDIAQRIQKTLSKKDLLKLSKIVLINKENPMLDVFNKAIHIEHGVTEVKDSNFFGLPIKHAFIITSKKINPPKT